VNRLFVSFLLIFILKFDFSYSQYTEIINSNRPGSSSGAFSVGKNILQLENGFYYTDERHQLLNYEIKGFGADFKIRYGILFDKLELIIGGVYQADNFTDNRYSPSYSFDRKNFKKFKIGAKYLLYDPKKGKEDKPSVYSYHNSNFDPRFPTKSKKFRLKNLIPAISAYVGMNLDSSNNPYTNTNVNGISPSAAIFTQSNITYRSVIITNLIFERIGSSQNDFEYIVSLTHAFSGSMIGFIETHGIKSDFYAENKISLGIAYLFRDNLQVDLGTSVNFKETPQIFHVGLGLSYRLNLNALR
tara:strand:+ start:327 stop:1229 length:903 start_codon:yes stop_codon:yes gene_type:complete